MEWWVQRQLDEGEQKTPASKNYDKRLKTSAAFIGSIVTAFIPILIPIMGVLIATAAVAAFGYLVAWAY